jgi:hypothetical protein
MRRRVVANNARNFADNPIDHQRVQACNAHPHERVHRTTKALTRTRELGKCSLRNLDRSRGT